MKSFAFILVAVLSHFPCFSQTQEINDCADAQVVCNDEDLAFNPDGPGMDDFADPDNDPGCITALEQNSAWYYFQIDPSAPPDLVLGFIIHPKGGYGEDYDWALYGPNVECGDLGTPIRCSSSAFSCGFCPDTGMGMGTTDFTEGPGTGDGFVMTLVVQPGQGFYLLIDNWAGTTNGFVLTWTDTAAPYLNCAAQPPCALSAVAGPDIYTCEGETSIPLNGGSTGNDDNETYTWSGTNNGTNYLDDPNIEDPTINLPGGFTGTIIYTLTVTEDTCMNVDQLELIVNPLPVVNINQIGPFCENNPPQTLSATPTGGTWGGDSNGNSFNPMTNGPGIHTVTYTYTDGNDCVTTESIDIEVYMIPDVVIDPDPAEFCDSEGSVLLTATGAGGAGGFSYNWNTPSGMSTGSTYDATGSGLYNVTVTDANGCTNTSVTTVTSLPNPIVEIVDPGPICQSVQFMVLEGIPSGGIFSGTIVGDGGDLYPNTIPQGTYPVSYYYVDSHGCDGTGDLNITIVVNPNAVPDNNGPVCQGQPFALFGNTDSTGTNITYLWTGPNGYTSNAQNPTNATLGGTYTLQVSIEDCPSPLEITDVVVIDMPDASALNGGPYCNGQSIQLFGNTSAPGNNVTYAWTGPNGYISDVQNPTDPTNPGIYSLVITEGNCASAIAQTDVVFLAPPDAAAANTGPYCIGDAITLSGNTSTTGNIITYTWSGPNGYASSIQNPTDANAPGLYTLIVNVDGCNSAIETTTITINSLPLPILTGQDTFCTGYSSIIDAGAGYVNYLWDDASLNQTLEVFSSGTYTVTVTDTNGCIGPASFAVTETASLSPVITGTLAFCEGSSSILDAGSIYSSYAWSTGEISQTIVITAGGNYGVVVTDADGCTGSANVTANVNANPNVTIGGSTTYCIGGFTVLDAGAGYSSYTWSNNSSTQTITVAAPGSYTVDIVDNNGCAGSATVTVDESTSLSPVITGNNAFCENGSTTLNAGSGFATYIWSDGTTTQNLFVNVAGTYSVTVSDGQSCSGESTISVTEVLPPVAVVQPVTQLCNTQAGGSVINLFDLVLSGDMNGSWVDSDNSGAVGLFTNLNFATLAAGDYRFMYTTNSAIAPCPESAYQVTITVLDCTCPDVFFFNAAPLCNESDILDLTTIENTAEPGIWSLIQTPAGTNPASLNGTTFDATASDPGQYMLQYDLQNQPPPGCQSDFQVIVMVDPAVDAGVATQPVSYCHKDDEIVSLAGLLIGADANGTWTETSTPPSQGAAFNPSGGTFNTTSQVPGIYTFNYALNSTGVCPDDATEVSVVINPLPIAMVAPVGEFNCSNTVLMLDAGGSSFGPAYDILWAGPGIVVDGNENGLHPTIDQPGNYLLTITHLQTGCINSASVTVIENTDAPTDALIDSQNPSCFGDQNGFINVDQVIGGVAPYLYSLNNAPFSSSSTYTNLSAGDYVLALQDANGCRWDSLIVIVEPSEISISVGPDIKLGLGESGTVQATVNLPSSQMDTLLWTPANVVECFDLACLEGTVYASNTMILTATVYDEYGCQASDDLTITVSKDRRLYIPNTFSPNGDGVNDIFFISGDDHQIVKIKKFQVFNRWGSLLYEVSDFLPNDPTNGWDGYFKNEIMNPGVFVYAAEIEYIDGVVELRTGDVTLLK